MMTLSFTSLFSLFLKWFNYLTFLAILRCVLLFLSLFSPFACLFECLSLVLLFFLLCFLALCFCLGRVQVSHHVRNCKWWAGWTLVNSKSRSLSLFQMVCKKINVSRATAIWKIRKWNKRSNFWVVLLLGVLSYILIFFFPLLIIYLFPFF